MKWKESPLESDLNESKLNVRKDNEKHFEIVPKICIEPENESERNPDLEGVEQVPVKRVIAATTAGSGSVFGVAINSDFLVLSDDLERIQHTINFEAMIDFVLWRRSVLLIGLSSSEILLINPNTYEVSERRKVCQNMDKVPDRFFVDGFIQSNPNPEKIDLVVIGVTGTIYTSRNISLSTGTLDCTYDDNNSIDIDFATIQGSIQKCLPEGAHVISAASPGREFFITGEKNGDISIFSTVEDSNHNRFTTTQNIMDILDLENEDTAAVRITKLVPCEGLLFVLLSTGQLEILLDEQLFATESFQLPRKDCVVQDFQLIVSNADSIKLWVLFSDVRENDHFVAICPAPSFRIEFLVRIPTTSDENAVFKFPNSASLCDEPTEICEITSYGTKIYKMTECSTDISLQNMLTKGNFAKAELLSRKYGKNLDLVWIAKLKTKYAEMRKAQPASEALFREIADTLLLIGDPEFVCRFCTKSFPKFEWEKECLAIGHKRVMECSGSQDGICLLQRIKVLYTFEQVFSTFEIEHWNNFCSPDTSMFVQCQKFLEKFEFDKSELIWHRHCDDFISEVELHHFVPFFKILFCKQLNSPQSVSLFQTIFPYAVMKCVGEDGIDGKEGKVGALIALVRAQIRALERDNDWPVGAITFVNIIISVISEEILNLETGEPEPEKLDVCVEIKKQLEKIVQSLKELGQLIRSHAIRISFEQYTTSSLVDAINNMLRVLFSKEEVEIFVKEFLMPFANRYRLKTDELLREHIEMIASDVPYFMTSGAIPFEERVVTLLRFIESPRIKLDCVLIMAKGWPVPWCSVMDAAVKMCLEMNVNGDSYCQQLQKTVELMRIQVPFRCLLQKYRLQASRLTLAFNVKHTIKRMLKSKKPNCYEDCLELIKHTGKCDENGIKYIKFWYELSETDMELEEILTENISPELVRSLLLRILHEFSLGDELINHSSDLWARYGECGRILANRLDDQKAVEFFKLREVIPNLWKDDIVTSMDFPFSALQLILENEHKEPVCKIIKSCHNLGRLTYSHLKDILVVTASFYVQQGVPGATLVKIWDILLHILQLPGQCHDKEIVPFAGVRIIQHLAHYFPTTSTSNLNALHNFCRLMLESFGDSLIEPIAKLIELILIFQDLREQEIPLEEELLSIYMEVWRGNWKGLESLLKELQAFGESLLRFGDTDLHLRVFHAVQREYLNQSQHSFGSRKQDLITAARRVEELGTRMTRQKDDYQVEEKNPRVVNLVKALQEIGLSMNAYALRLRNKRKLIEKLIEMNCFALAAQTALAFDFKDNASWSSILQEYINKATEAELKTLLESLKRITELWILPEFATAWLKVSEKFPMFRHMCPIRLE